MKLDGAQLTLVVIGSLFSSLFVWAGFYQVDQVVRADAKVMPVKDVVRVQNRFPGAIEDVLIELGDRVRKGQVLFRLDPEETEIDLSQTKLALLTQQSIAARLDAQINSGAPNYPENTPEDILASQNSVLASKRSELTSRARLIESKIDALNLAISETKTSTTAARRQAGLAREEIALLEPLVKTGAEPRLRLIQANRALNDLLEHIDVGKIRVQRLAADLESERLALVQESEQFILEAHEQLAEAQVEVSRLHGELERADDRRAKSEVTSPIDGVVTALPFAVVGQVANSGTTLAELVPIDTSYKVEAKIKPMDVTSVKVGQIARLSLVAYDFADYGHIEVTLDEVAQNLTEPQQSEPYYRAELSIANAAFSKTGHPVELMPGLIGQIDILGEPVTVLDYVSKPIKRISSRALTEQ